MISFDETLKQNLINPCPILSLDHNSHAVAVDWHFANELYRRD